MINATPKPVVTTILIILYHVIGLNIIFECNVFYIYDGQMIKKTFEHEAY